jgi:transposase
MQYYAGIDYHKRYSVVEVIDTKGNRVVHARVNGNTPEAFGRLFGSLGGPCKVVFESCLNWCYLYEILEQIPEVAECVMANAYKTRIIAEAKVKKTDKVDARLLAELLRGDLICQAHIPRRRTRLRKELLRQRTFWVRQRTRLRNRIHELLGRQHGVELPQVSDLFGVKGMAALRKLELEAPASLLLEQDLTMLESVGAKVKENEQALSEELAGEQDVELLRSLPGVGLILGATIACEIDGIERFANATKLCGYAGLCPKTSSSGGKTYYGALIRHCNKWLRWALVEAAWVAVNCDPYFGALYKRQRARGKLANTSITVVAKRLCRIAYQLLSQKRPFENRALKTKTFPGRSGPALAAPPRLQA